MEKPKILFIESLWLDQNPELGITNAEHYLWDTYRQYGGEYKTFNYDQWLEVHKYIGDKACLELVEDYDPDLVFLDWHLGSNINPTPETLREINLVKKIPVVAIWWDHVWESHIKYAEMLQYWVNLNVVVDSSSFYARVAEPEKYLFLWTPQSKEMYYPSDKTVEFGFYGRVGRKPPRAEILEKLKKDFPDFIHGGGRREKPVSKEEYSRAYRSTEMVLNFSGSNSGYPQLVGRTMEALQSGCLLLEQANPETAGMFTPGIDYVEWTDYDDLKSKVNYYRQNKHEMRKIAESGNRKALKYYNSDVWWDKVLNEL